ncbi:MAG: MarR family transcriptional regulator [Verrucomicrobiales bacterium]|jgi:DNA-binding MarR family transcriptional regulator|nr:MarR family transcriptional regulator [Verrucomicrobiales bacterium]
MSKNNFRSVYSPEIQRLAEVALYLQRNFLTLITERVTKNNMSVSQFNLLGFLSQGHSLNMNKLASLMRHTMPATTGLMDRLVQAGLVERLASKTDRRQVLAKITPKGTALFNELKSQIAFTLSEITEKLSDDDLAAWLRIYNATHEYFVGIKYIEP